MYRDNSLMPKEAVRLAVLGTLVQNREMRYGEVAAAVRRFTDRIIGPSLDLMGTSLEMLRYEGLVEAIAGTSDQDNALLGPTAAGRQEFDRLMQANVRSPSSDGLNKLVITLKLRFLHLLEPLAQREQVSDLIELYQSELARLIDLRDHFGSDQGYLNLWLSHDIAQVETRLAWFERFHGGL